VTTLLRSASASELQPLKALVPSAASPPKVTDPRLLQPKNAYGPTDTGPPKDTDLRLWRPLKALDATEVTSQSNPRYLTVAGMDSSAASSPAGRTAESALDSPLSVILYFTSPLTMVPPGFGTYSPRWAASSPVNLWPARASSRAISVSPSRKTHPSKAPSPISSRVSQKTT
jgi:hypothetical protein